MATSLSATFKINFSQKWIPENKENHFQIYQTGIDHPPSSVYRITLLHFSES